MPNTACRITADRGAEDRRGRTSLAAVDTNTGAVVVADITIDDRQAGCPVNKIVTATGDSVGVVVADNAVSDCHAGTTTAVGERQRIEDACSGVVADDAVGNRHGSSVRTSGIVTSPANEWPLKKQLLTDTVP